MTRFERFRLRAFPWLTSCASAMWGFSGGADWRYGHHRWALVDWALWALFAWLTWRACGQRPPCSLAEVDAQFARATNDPMSRSSTTFNTSCPCPHCQGAMEELRVEGERRMVAKLASAPKSPEARAASRQFLIGALRILDDIDAKGKTT